MHGSKLICLIDQLLEKVKKYKTSALENAQYITNLNTKLNEKDMLLKKMTNINSARNLKIVIIGGGPIGLIIGCKLNSFGHEVTIVEHRKEYTRGQTLVLQESFDFDTISNIPEEVFENLFKRGACLLDTPTHSQRRPRHPPRPGPVL